MVRAERMVLDHLGGMLAALVPRATNAAAESIDARFQRLKAWPEGTEIGSASSERSNPTSGLGLHPRPLSDYPISGGI